METNKETEGKQLILEINEITSSKDASFSLLYNSLSMEVSTNLEDPKEDTKVMIKKTFEF